MEEREALKLIKKLKVINNHSRVIHRETGKRQIVVLNDPYQYEVLYKVHLAYKDYSRMMIGSLSVIMPHCTIRAYREYFNGKNKKH